VKSALLCELYGIFASSAVKSFKPQVAKESCAELRKRNPPLGGLIF